MKAVLQNARAMRTASLSGHNKHKNRNTSPNNNNNNSHSNVRSPTNHSNRSPSPSPLTLTSPLTQSYIQSQSFMMPQHQVSSSLDQFSQQSQSMFSQHPSYNKYNGNLSCVLSQPSLSVSNYPLLPNSNANGYYYGQGYRLGGEESQPTYANHHYNYNYNQNQN